MPDLSPSGRRCPACASVQPVFAGEPIWPLGRPCNACGHIVPHQRGVSMFAPDLADTINGFDPKSFDELSQLEAEHFWFIARNELIVGLMNKYFPEARRFMEVGCGTGFVLRAIAQSRKWDRVVGSELHPAGLEYAKGRLPSEAELIQMDARHIPAESLFDLTGAFDVIEHIADDEAVLRGMRASMLEGGGIIVTVPQHPWLWSRADEVACHQRRYRRGELEAKLRQNGFKVLFSSSFTALLLPLMAASRLRRNKADEDAYEFRLNSTVNQILLRALQSEVAMTLAGVRWAAGGSRVVVARAI
ncbi:methyltransferase domain-containing protein [Bradyrhizobium sp. AUGA SZCCT0283]|nr:methyltransferase domain-containing protein [Bradyrhizobium sp. AUGA SZCCT0283]